MRMSLQLQLRGSLFAPRGGPVAVKAIAPRGPWPVGMQLTSVEAECYACWTSRVVRSCWSAKVLLDVLGFELRSHLLTQLRRIDCTHVMLAKGQMH